MYAYALETGGGFFEGVCAPGNATAYFRDPPPPRNKEPEPQQWGLRPEVDHAPYYRGRRFGLG